MCRKGENIRKRKDGRWEARYIKYRDPEGKIHYGSLYGKTYGEVKDKRNKKIAEVPGYGHLVRNPGILNYQLPSKQPLSIGNRKSAIPSRTALFLIMKQS